MAVRDHTYFLASEDRVLGARPEELAPFLRETWEPYARQMTGNELELSRVDGVSVWWAGDVRHVAVTHRRPEWDRSATLIVEPALEPGSDPST